MLYVNYITMGTTYNRWLKSYGTWQEQEKGFEWDYMIKRILATLGLGFPRRSRGERKSPVVTERERFEAEAKDQFLKLKEKGLSIPVFTL